MKRAPHPMDAFDTEAEISALAVEQAIHWACAGVTPEMALFCLGVAWTAQRGPGWYDVQLAVASAWRAMQSKRRGGAVRLRRAA